MFARIWVLAGLILSTACADKAAPNAAGNASVPGATPVAPAPAVDAGPAKAAAPAATSSNLPPPPAAPATPGPTPAAATPPAADGGASGVAAPAAQAAGASASAGASGASAACKPRPFGGASGVHFHHVHFNTTDPAADRAFYEKFFGVPSVEFCKDEAGKTRTMATQTERGYFLYTQVAKAPDPALNTYLEHIGWLNPDPAAELQRLVKLDAPRFPVGRAQCDSAFKGEAPCLNYWFYLQAPNGARVEVASGPGPATKGFGHVHLVMGEDYGFFTKVSGGSFMTQNQSIDDVNHTDALLVESVLDTEMVTETRGKPIDHIAYSTTTLEADKQRIVGEGIKIEEDISFKPEYGFRSFFVKSPKGIWVELVEDARFGQ